jgi:predicted KAP-like P-loop ATPase
MRKQMESIEEFQSALRQLVERLLERKPGEALKDRKVIFFIDDLDRCLPTVALEIMETIKTFLDAEGCVYVLLCDQQLLGQGVRAKFKELFGDEDSDAYQRRGREYVEKIIQVSFQIPPTNEEQ